MPIPGLKTRTPTGAVPYPCILLEGEEKAGKTWAAALLSASDKVGETYWIDVAEGAADEYGVIPGVRYQIIEHDGSYQQILAAVTAVKAEAKRAAAAGEKPVVLVIDTGSALWNGLKDWVDVRSRNTTANKAKLAKDPDAELKAPQNFWNDARSRWYKVMNQLLTFPGIVVVTSRGREVSKVVNGKPVEGEKTWRAEVQESFPYDVNVWIRMFRDERPVVVGARSAHLGIIPGKDAEREIKAPEADGRLLEWLIFDALRCDPGKIVTREMPALTMGGLSEEEKAVQDAEDAEAMKAEQPAAQRPTRQRPQAPQAQGRSPEEWARLVAEAKNPERVYALHHEANGLGQLSPELDKAMRARVEEMKQAAKPAAVAGPIDAAEGREQGLTGDQLDGDDGQAEVERLMAEAERRGMLVDELKMISQIIGHPVEKITARSLPEGPEDAEIEKLQKAVANLRGMTITKLRSDNRGAEADAYAQVKDTEWDIPSALLGHNVEGDQKAA